MSKRKTVLAVLLVSVLVSAGVLLMMYEYYAGQLRARMVNIRNDYRLSAEETFATAITPEKAMLDFTKNVNLQYANALPYFAAVTDCDGNVLAETQNILYCHIPAEDGISTLKFCASLSPEMTRRLTDAAALVSPKRRIDTIYVKSADFSEQNGAYVPVQAKICCTYPNDTRHDTVVRFSDLPVTLTAEWAQLMLYYPLNNGKRQKELFFMRDQIHRLKDRLAQYAADPEAPDPFADIAQFMESCLYDRACQNAITIFPVTLGNETYFFILQYVSRLTNTVFQWYYPAFTTAGVLLLFACCAAMILALWFVKRKSALQTSRYSFLAVAAHELKTPLSVITSAGECIRDGVSPEKNAAYAGMILHEGKRMQSLLEDMLRENRLLSADGVKKTRADLSALALREAAVYADAAAQKNITLITEVTPGLRAEFDAELLRVALDNFLSNAVKYAPAGETITVYAVQNGRKATVTVHNTGSRISPAALPHVWEELYREDTVRGDGAGSGLGLSIARRIFELHRMRYGCASNEAGTAFWFTLPLLKRKQAPADAKQSKPGKRSSGEWLCMTAVLCVAAALPFLAAGLYAEWNPGFIAAIVLAVADTFSGLLGILSTALSWREKTRPRRKALLVLTVIALLLPPLIYAFFYVAGANGW